MIEQPTSHPDTAQLEAAKRRVHDILVELKTLSKAETDESRFFNQLLSRTIETTAANGAIIWQIDADGALSKTAELGSTISQLELQVSDFESHDRLIRTAIGNNQSITFEPNSSASGEASLTNATPYLLLIHPLNETVAGRRFAIELFQRPDITPAARTGYIRFLNEVGDLFLSWQARHQLRRRQAEDQKSKQILDFIRDIHSSLNPVEVSYTAANDGRVLFDCDRMTVLSFDSRRAKVLAVSGQDEFDNRSNVVQKQQRLASIVCRNKQLIWLGGQEEELPRGVGRVVEDYQNEAHARTLAVVPLFRARRSDAEAESTADTTEQTGEPLGALILEWFTLDVPRQDREYEVKIVSENVARALNNSAEHRSIFLLWLWKLIGKWTWLVKARTLPKTILALGAAISLIAFLALFPYPFDMRVDGELQPVERHNVYANIDGIVKQVHVDHGQVVAKGDLLLEMRNDELELKLTSALGELAEIDQDIRTTKASGLMTDNDGSRQQIHEAEARLERLRQRWQSVNAELQLLRRMEEKLKIFSPIGGTVVSWDPKRQLEDRPVSHQDVVLVIADVDSEWQMELFIPERKYGHVIKFSDQPEITFFAATDPQYKFKGKVQEIEAFATEHEGHGMAVRAIANFDQSNAPELYVGAAVTAKIHCGKAPVGYAWFHELFEFVQSRLLF